MPTYFWIPNRDSAYQGEFTRLAKDGGKNSAPFNGKFLPPEDLGATAYSYAGHPKYATMNTYGMTAGWDELQDDDELYIGAHGGARDSSKVAWVSDAGVPTWWTAKQLGDSLAFNLLTGTSPSLKFHLYACFGANNYFKTGDCFGVRLSREMLAAGLRGTLTAYNGAVGLNASGGQQTGSSRITCAFWYAIGKSHHNSGSTKSMGKTWALNPYTRGRSTAHSMGAVGSGRPRR